MGERFAREGMKVVLADVEDGPLAEAVGKLQADGLEVIGVRDRRGRLRLGRGACATRALEALRRASTSCATTPASAPAPRARCGSTSSTTGAGRSTSTSTASSTASTPSCRPWSRPESRRPRRQHLVGQRRGVAAARHSPVRGDQGRRGDADRVPLRPAAATPGRPSGRRCSFPGPTCCGPGIFSSWRNCARRELAKERPRATPYPTIEDIEAQMAAAGITPQYTEPAEVADQVVARRAGRAGSGSWPEASRPTPQIRARAESMLSRANPDLPARRCPGDPPIPDRTEEMPPMNHYLVISSDCHAGLPNEQYREWLDPELPGRVRPVPGGAGRPWRPSWPSAGCATRSSPRSGSRRTPRGSAAGGTPDAATQELDADGVVGEVIFPDADAVTGGASAPFGAGLGRSTADVPHRPADGRGQGPQPMAGRAVRREPRPPRRGGHRADLRRRRGGGRDHAGRGSPGLRGGILIPSMWQPHEPYSRRPVRPGVGGLPRPRDARPRPLRRRRPGQLRRARRHLRGRGPLVVDPPVVVPAVGGYVRAVPRPTVRHHRVRGLLGAGSLWTSDIVYDREHAAKKLGQQPDRPGCRCGRASTSTATASSGRPTPGGASWPGATRSGSATSCGATTSPTPRGPGPTPGSGSATPSTTSPSTRPQQILGSNAAGLLQVRHRGAACPWPTGSARAPRSWARRGDDLGKWADLAAAGRPWLTGKEALELPVGE